MAEFGGGHKLSTMSLKFLLMAFFLAITTSSDAFLMNCNQEKHNLIIVAPATEIVTAESNEKWIEILLRQILLSLGAAVTGSERVSVTCLLYYHTVTRLCPAICDRIKTDYNVLFNTTCLKAPEKGFLRFGRSAQRRSIRSELPFSRNSFLYSLRDKQPISIIFDPQIFTDIYLRRIAYFSKHTFIISDYTLYGRYVSLQGITMINMKYHTHESQDALICADCRDGWTPFVDPRTKTLSSCYFVVHGNETKLNISNAVQTCQNMGANMVSIETEEEFQFVQDLLRKTLNVSGPETWCRQQNNSVCLALNLTRHGNIFRWGQGRPLVISPPWSSSLEKSGDCVTWVLSHAETGHSGVWRQVDCNVRDRYTVICEVEMFRKNKMDFIKTGPEFVQYNQDIVSVAAYLEDDIFYSWYAENIYRDIKRFSCADESSTSIAYSFVCDSKPDCPNGRDEEICTVRNKETFEGDTTLYIHNLNSSITTDDNTSKEKVIKSRLYFDFPRRLNGLCAPQADVSLFENTSNVTHSVPANWTMSSLWPDILSCSKGPAPVDTIGSNQTMTCVMAPKCLYIKSCEGDVIGCQDLTHLQSCTTYKCPSGYSKCPLSYCIPETYVNDGTQDCPQGEDENNLLKCFNTSQYVFLENVCDGFKDCPRGDDEVNCHVECPKGVTCSVGTAFVPYSYSDITDAGNYTSIIDNSIRTLRFYTSNIDSVQFHIGNGSQLIELDCYWMNLQSQNLTFLKFLDDNIILNVNFGRNLFTKITPAGSFSKMKNLKKLDLSHNTELETFRLSLPFLETLDLSYTGISSLDMQIFQKMRNLRYLYLTGTKITNLNFIPASYTLNVLDIFETNMENIGVDYFNHLTITELVSTSSFKLCCPQALGENIPVDKCKYTDNSISSCQDLVSDVSKRTLLWAIGLLALLGNVFALAYRIIWDRKSLHTVYGQFVSNLCISDMIMGFYLIIIGVADEVYRDNYFVREEEWQYGVVCQLAGFLSTLSSEVTTFFICLITLDRFLTLRFQTGKYRFTTRTKRASIILSWLLGFSLALVPVLCPEWGIFTSNSMCLAFPLDTNLSGGRYYSVALFLGLNFILFLSIIVGQFFIFRSLSSRRYVSSFSNVNLSRRTQDVLVARQLSLVAVTNILAWVPVQVMGSLVLAGVVLDNDVYSWTAVFVLPLNSALNPAVYSFPKMYNLFKSIKNSCRK